jgi:hypothetical protein
MDDDGRVMATMSLSLEPLWSRPSRLGGTLVDVCVLDHGCALPGRDARPAWELWREGRPRNPGSWHGLNASGQQAWLALASQAATTARADRIGGVYHLDSTQIRDVTSLHCALGEAIAGPGGYYGREWNGFKDCLCGGFGVVPPFTLVWQGFAAAARAFDRAPDADATYLEGIVDVMRRYGVTVVVGPETAPSETTS